MLRHDNENNDGHPLISLLITNMVLHSTSTLCYIYTHALKVCLSFRVHIFPPNNFPQIVCMSFYAWYSVISANIPNLFPSFRLREFVDGRKIVVRRKKSAVLLPLFVSRSLLFSLSSLHLHSSNFIACFFFSYIFVQVLSRSPTRNHNHP